MDLKTLFKISYGLYVVSSKKDEQINAQVANTCFQITSEPPTFAVSINKKNLTHEFIEASKVFCVGILAEKAPLDFIGGFGFHSGRDTDKFQNVPFETGVTGSPIIDQHMAGYIEAEVISSLDVETHTIFIGKIVAAENEPDVKPMTYAHYHELKSGKVPPAPAAAPPEKTSEGGKSTLKKYRCTVCGYIYDPEQGDPDSGIKPGTAFEDIPDDWVCPVCGVAKDQFEVVE